MPIKISKKQPPFIPDVVFIWIDDENGEESVVRNRALDKDKQIRATLTLAGAGEKSLYMDRVNETDISTQKISVVDKLDFDQAVVDKCHMLEGLEDVGIRTGVDLVKFPATTLTNDLIFEIYHKICGTHTDDNDIPTPEKSKPSE